MDGGKCKMGDRDNAAAARPVGAVTKGYKGERRGRKPRALIAVEWLAVDLWQMPEYVDPSLWWRRVAAEMFGMGAMLRRLDQEQAATLAYWLSSLAEHIAHGDLPLPSQSDFATAGGGWLNGGGAI